MQKPMLDGKTILIVEDEFLLADELTTALQRAGAKILGPVASHREAMKLLETVRIDLAVLDIQLQDGTSYPIADWLRLNEVPFIFATGFGEDAIMEAYRAIPRWEKPFSEDRLIEGLAAAGR